MLIEGLRWRVGFLRAQWSGQREAMRQARQLRRLNRMRGVQVAPFRAIHPTVAFDMRDGRLMIATGAEICAFVILAPYGGEIALGSNIYVGPHTVLYGHGGLRIGTGTLIAAHVTIVPTAHCFEDPGRAIREQGEAARGIQIGDDVWIGCGARILDGVTIGSGAVVGAGSVVTRDVAPLSVVVGVPAKPVRSRTAAQSTPDRLESCQC